MNQNIHPQDLRLGNYVMYKGKPKKISSIHHVIGDAYEASFFTNITTIDASQKSSSKPIPLGWLSPIPLTEDVLLRAGFSHCSCGGWKHAETKFHLHKDFDPQLFKRASNDKLKFVHSLQNTFFVVTGQELTINL